MKLIVYTLTLMFGSTLCDLKTNCTFEETVGKWMLYVGQTNLTNRIECSNVITLVKQIKIQLLFPDKVVDEFGNVGTWTMVYNQGFSITLAGRRYFAFQFYQQTGAQEWTSYCNSTFNGWVHDTVENNVYPPANWGCYYARKMFTTNTAKVSKKMVLPKLIDLNKPYGLQQEFVDKINKHQSSWKAGIYEEYQNYTLGGMIRRAGGIKYLPRIHPRKTTLKMEKMAAELPVAFDWRNKSGDNFVSPVRNQGSCGSCYAFASMGLLEAGARIETNNRIQPVFSTQDVVSCSHYSQGCEGGFPYLIAGMYAQDYGVVTEDCYPYIGNDTKTCSPVKQGVRFYVSEYGYVGGFYGGCNEPLMRVALLKYGPLVVGINVTADFMHYKGGIYHHTGLRNGVQFNPLEITNHAVLVVGYGVDQDSGEKFWIVKNSWGTSWGEDGFFRIRRGTDEIAIESLAVYAKPYVGH